MPARCDHSGDGAHGGRPGDHAGGRAPGGVGALTSFT